MKKMISVALCLLMGCSAFAQPDGTISINAVSTVATSPDERFIAVIDETSEGRVLHVFTCCESSVHRFSVQPDTLAKFIEGPHLEGIVWSPDGKFLKLELSDRGEDHVLVLLDPRAGVASLRAVKVGTAPAAWGSWSIEGHRLYVVPSAPDDSGIYVVDPIAGSSKRLISGYRVATDLSVTKNTVITKVEEVNGDILGYALISIDATTGAVRRLF